MAQTQTEPQANGEEQPEPFAPELIPQKPIPANLAEIIQELIDCDRRIKSLDAQIKEEKALYSRLEPVLVEQFAANNMQNQKMKTGETVFVRRDVYVSLVKAEDGSLGAAHQALRDHGLGDLVRDNVNGNQLSGWYRERMKQEEEIPVEILPYLNISDIFRVRVRQ